LIQAARQVNFQQRQAVVDKLQGALKGLRGRLVAVFGLAFKAGTDDVREAPALDVIRLLVERGAHVRAHDPLALERAREVLGEVDVELCSDPYAAASGTDGLILATDWPEYRSLDLPSLARRMRTPVMVDGRNFFAPEDARRAGFT